MQSLPSAPHPPHKSCGLQTAARGWRGEQREERAGVREDVQPKPWELRVSVATLHSQNPVSQDNSGRLARGPANFPHSQTTTTRQGREVLGKWRLSHLLVTGIGLPSPNAHHPRSQAVSQTESTMQPSTYLPLQPSLSSAQLMPPRGQKYGY